MRKRIHPSTIAAMTLLSAIAAHADDSSYLDLNPDAPGQSTAPGHAGWIDVDKVSWSVTAETSWLKGGGVSVAKPKPGAISWTQGIEPSVIELHSKILGGENFSNAQFDTVAPGSPGGAPHTSIQLENLFMTHVGLENFDTVEAAGVFKSIKLSYDPHKSGQAPTVVTYDVSSGTTSGSTINLPTVPLGSAGMPAASPGGPTRAYLRLDAATAGDSDVMGYENWIEIGDLGFSIDAETSFLVGSGVSVGKPVPGSLSWTQDMDATVPLNLRKIASGTSLSEGVIELVKFGSLGPVTFMQLAMTDVFFTDITLADGAVSESVVFKTLDQIVYSINADGTRGAGLMSSYNIPDGTVQVGSPTLVNQLSGFGAGNLAPVPGVPVPLPQAWMLMLAGSALMSQFARRRAAA